MEQKNSWISLRKYKGSVVDRGPDASQCPAVQGALLMSNALLVTDFHIQCSTHTGCYPYIHGSPLVIFNVGIMSGDELCG